MVSSTASCSSNSGTNAIATDPDTATDSSASARRARKREQDRRCQRMLRERTKNRIAYLEGLLADYEREGSSAALHILRRERDEAVEDRDRLAHALRTINRVVKTSVPSLETLPSTDAGSERQVGTRNRTPLDEALVVGADRGSGTIPDEDDNGENAGEDGDEKYGTQTFNTWKSSDTLQTSAGCLITQSDPATHNMVSHTWCPTSPSSIPGLGSMAYSTGPTVEQATVSPLPTILNDNTCECSVQPPPGAMTPPPNLWTLSNDILGEPIPWSHEISQWEDILAEDIPVRAVVEGWDAAANSVGGILPPSWQQLRKVDEGLFFICGTTERLAVLRTMHALVMAQADTTLERRKRLPDWYIARPGVRERFVFHPHRYCSNKFWTTFAGSFRIRWPYEFRDCYTRSTHTGRYNISPTFQERVRDIRAFTMREELFQLWPELRVDIPAFESIGRSITPELPVSAQSLVTFRRLSTTSTAMSQRNGKRQQNAVARRVPPLDSVYVARDKDKSLSTTVSEVESFDEATAHTNADSVLGPFGMTPAFEGAGYDMSSWSA